MDYVRCGWENQNYYSKQKDESTEIILDVRFVASSTIGNWITDMFSWLEYQNVVRLSNTLEIVQREPVPRDMAFSPTGVVIEAKDNSERNQCKDSDSGEKFEEAFGEKLVVPIDDILTLEGCRMLSNLEGCWVLNNVLFDNFFVAQRFLDIHCLIKDKGIRIGLGAHLVFRGTCHFCIWQVVGGCCSYMVSWKVSRYSSQAFS